MTSYWRVYLLAGVGFLVGTVEFVVAGILDEIASRFHVSLATAGQLITLFSVVFAIGTPILVAVTARVERKNLLVTSLFVFFLGNLIAYFSHNIGMLLVSRIILALSIGIFQVVGIAMAPRLAPPSKQGGAIATVITGISSSLVLGVPIGREVAAYADWHDIFAGMAVYALIAMISVWKLIPKILDRAVLPIGEQIVLLSNPKVGRALFVCLKTGSASDYSHLGYLV